MIGPGGSNIRSVETSTGCAVCIDRRIGEVLVVGAVHKLEEAKDGLVGSVRESFYTVGERHSMKVVELLDFGGILESTAPTKNRGFCPYYRVGIASVHDVLTVGQVLEFQCLVAGTSGKMSLKALNGAALQETATTGP
jgi:polyribonucleotide nucleotidyltransferase